MKYIRRLLLGLSLIVLIVCFILLINRTAPNPTHRRYSSRAPLSTGQGTIQAIGADAERILSSDLDIQRNEETIPRQYICQKPSGSAPSDGKCVFFYAGLNAASRRPDFISSDLIAESKNRQSMLESDRELLSQIGDYSLVAITMKRPLWIFTRVDTEIDPKYYQLAEATGGGIVRYFAVPGYTDPVDSTARTGALASTAVSGICAASEVLTHRKKAIAPPRQAESEPVGVPPATRSTGPAKHITKTTEILDRAGEIAQRGRDKFPER